MKNNYGLPYKGSKNTIAERIVKLFPKGGRFLDVCCGGGAISQSAYLSGKYDSVTGVDINKSIIVLLNAVMVKGGLIDYEKRPLVTREDFLEAKGRWDDGNLEDAVTRYVASFGFNGQDYLWGEARLEYKYLSHRLVTEKSMFKRRELLRDFVNLIGRLGFQYGTKDFDNLSYIEQMQNLQRIKMVEDEMEAAKDVVCTKLCFECASMFEIFYDDYDVIYIDPPYASAQRRYNHKDFSRIMFKALLRALVESGKTVFVSEYDCPAEGFTEIASFSKACLQCATSNFSVIERVFFGGTLEQYRKICPNSGIGIQETAGGEPLAEDDTPCDDSFTQ